jgi:hypothetical protein
MHLHTITNIGGCNSSREREIRYASWKLLEQVIKQAVQHRGRTSVQAVFDAGAERARVEYAALREVLLPSAQDLQVLRSTAQEVQAPHSAVTTARGRVMATGATRQMEMIRRSMLRSCSRHLGGAPWPPSRHAPQRGQQLQRPRQDCLRRHWFLHIRAACPCGAAQRLSSRSPG